MADETKEPAAAVAVEETKEEPAAEEQKDDGNASEHKKRGSRKDEAPIEEMFDLSKPLKKVERPSKDEHEKELAALTERIDTLKEDRRALQTKIDDAMDSGKNSEIGKQREALSKLRAKKGALIEEKKAIRVRLDKTRNQADRLVKDRKDTKSHVRFTNVADIDKEIAKLQRRQETTSMSLAEEKRLIKEMDALTASKKTVAELKAKESSLEDVKEQRKAIAIEIAAKDKEIDAVQKEIEEKNAAVQALSEKETDKRGALQSLFAERDEIKKQMNDAHKEKDACRQTFREKNNAWYNYQRAQRAQRQMQYEEEKKKREEEKAAWLKKKEEEEMKKIPYEEEMALCDYLANYLTVTYLTDAGEEKRKQKEEAEKKKQADVVQVKDDPFAGFKPVKKNDDEVFLQMGKGKKKGKGKARNSKKAASKPAPFTLNVDSFEQFGLLNLSPPTSLDTVEASVKELNAKKQWYSEQPRGSVPTAADIRKANEKAAAKLKQANATNGDISGSGPSTKSGGASGGGKKKNVAGAFSLSDDDFAPLGGSSSASAASMSLNSKWGQKTEAPEPEMNTEAPAAAEGAEEVEGTAEESS